MSALEAALRAIVRDELARALMEHGLTSREYSSRGPLPAGVTARAFRAACKSASGAGVAGFRVEGTTVRARVYFAAIDAWHRHREAPRPTLRAVAAHDDDDDAIVARALRGAR